MKYTLKYLYNRSKIKPQRYKNLVKLIYKNSCKNILEVGVFNGKNSLRMIETAKAFSRSANINYYGFDLFEILEEEDLKKEFSKYPLSEAEIYSKLTVTKCNIHLYKGYSQNTLPEFVNKHKDIVLDFIFIDGGHSIDTITSDWNNLKVLLHPKTIVIFDDYYIDPATEIENMGCNKLIDSLDRNQYNVSILPPQDQFEKDWGVLKINFVKVQLNQ